MLKRAGFLASLLVVVFLAAQASAAVVAFSDGGTALQNVLDGITVGGTSGVDVTVDGVADALDSYWSITGSSATVTTFVFTWTSQNGQEFGVYDALDLSNKAVLFTGKPGVGNQVVFSMDTLGNWAVTPLAGNSNSQVSTGSFASGNLFGYYLTTDEPIGGTFYSDTLLNDDGFDHMAAFAGEGDTIKIGNNTQGTWTSAQYILAWEDAEYFQGTPYALDFDDFVVMVESVEPVPEPAAMLVWGFLGIVGLCWMRRRKA